MKKIIGIVCLTSLLSACGGGGGTKITDSNKAAGLSACDPSSGPAGTKVVCSVKGMTEESTLFFDKKPVDFALNEEDGAVSFTVPPTLVKEKKEDNEKDIYFQEGDTGVKTIGAFEVTNGSPAGSDEVAPAGGPTGTTTGDMGEVINPTGPGGTSGGGTTTGVETPPDSDGDGVPDTTDACPGTAPGKTVDSTGCEPPPPAPTSATIDKFEVTAATASNAKMSTYNVSWTFTGAKAAYLFGNLLNRDAADAALAEADRCKLAGTRYLVTGPDGNDINKNLDENAATPNLKKTNRDYLEGILCNNANASEADDCKTSSTAALETGSDAKAFAGRGRFNDGLLDQDRYSYKASYRDMGDIELQKDHMNFKPDYVIPLVPAEDNPQCRIDLKKKGDASGTLIPTGSFTTRSLAQHGQACLAVQGSDDKWVVKCKNVDAKPAVVEVLSGNMKGNALKVELKFSYSGAVSIPTISAAAGCSPDPGPSWPSYSGPSGSIDAVCDMSKTGDLTTHVTATVHGIGQNNADTKKVVASLEAPSVTFDWNGTAKTLAEYDHSSIPAAQDSGKVEFKWTVKRNFKIKDEDTGDVLDSGNTHWIDHLEFIEWNVGWAKSLQSTKNIGAGDDYGIIKMTRNHHTTGWSIRGYDYGASKPFNVDLPTEQPMITWGYDTSFSVSGDKINDHWVDACDQCCGGWDCDGECGPCAETTGTHMTVEAVWSGSNIKKITSTCGQLTVDQPSKEYGPQTGSVTGQFNMGNSFPQEDCDYTAEFYDGTTKTQHSSWNTSCDDARCNSDT